MSDPIRSALIQALTLIFQPIARIALRHGLSFRACSDVLKWCFASIAHEEFGLDGKPNSKSRVAVITGITRVEVDRLLKQSPPSKDDGNEKYHRASRVLTAWAKESKYQLNGSAIELPFEDENNPSFSSLVYEFSGGTPARPVLDELIRVGSVKETGPNRYQLMRPYYVPVSDEKLDEKMHILGYSTQMLLDTIEHNIQADQPVRYFQRIALNRNLSAENLEQFQVWLSEKGQTFINAADQSLCEISDGKSTRPYTAGIGLYYFQEQLDALSIKQSGETP